MKENFFVQERVAAEWMEKFSVDLQAKLSSIGLEHTFVDDSFVIYSGANPIDLLDLWLEERRNSDV